MQKKAFDTVPIIIRKATAEDINHVVKLESEYSPASHKKQQYEAELSNALSYFYVAVDPSTDEIIGYVIFWIIENLIEIHQITVKEIYRRSGVGHTLMKTVLQKAREESVEQIYLEVRKSNQNAIAFYRKLGFTESGFRKTYYQNPVDDALVLNKLL